MLEETCLLFSPHVRPLLRLPAKPCTGIDRGGAQANASLLHPSRFACNVAGHCEFGGMLVKVTVT